MQATLPDMAVRGWGAAAGAASGVAAGVAAAQAGLGYGLGVIAWLPADGAAAEPAWVASLTWAVWVAATSTVVGALGGARLTAAAAPAGAIGGSAAPGPAKASGGWVRRGMLAVAAALGGALSIALVAVPAREASQVVGPGAQPAAAGYALAGVALGFLFAIWALSAPAVARNLVITIVWTWMLAVATVVAAVVTGRPSAGAPLGGWPDWAAGSSLWFRELVFWPAAALSLGSALVVGVLAAWSLARQAHLRVGATISGGVGPALAAAAHLIAPLPDGTAPEQVSATFVAPYAVIAGLAGSALAAGFAQRRVTRADSADPEPVDPADVQSADADPVAVDPADAEAVAVDPADADPATDPVRRIPDQVGVQDSDRRATGDPGRAPAADGPGSGTAGPGSTGAVPDQRSSPDERE